MFIHPEEDYDFVVKLQPTELSRYFQSIAADPLTWTDKDAYSLSTDGEGPFRPGFDPVEVYLYDLTVRTWHPVVVVLAHLVEKRVYSDTAKFFYDPLGGDRFGGIWDPSLTKPLPFRVLNRFSSTATTPKVCLGSNFCKDNTKILLINREKKKEKTATSCFSMRTQC